MKSTSPRLAGLAVLTLITTGQARGDAPRASSAPAAPEPRDIGGRIGVGVSLGSSGPHTTLELGARADWLYGYLTGAIELPGAPETRGLGGGVDGMWGTPRRALGFTGPTGMRIDTEGDRNSPAAVLGWRLGFEAPIRARLGLRIWLTAGITTFTVDEGDGMRDEGLPYGAIDLAIVYGVPTAK